MPTNRKDHLRFRYGICLNDGCSKCKSKEVQQIAARKDFVCEECQKPLRECPPPKSFWDKYGKLITAAVFILVAAIVILIVINLPKDKPAEVVTEGPDTTAVVPQDTITEVVAEVTDSTAEVAEVTEVAAPATDIPATKPVAPAQQSSVKVPFGTYSGPANGLDGEIKVTRNYTLDLRNAAHESIELQPGDIITRTKFKNGELVAGYWKRGSETRAFHR